MEEIRQAFGRYYGPEQAAMLERAYIVAQQAHGDQVRSSGEPYMIHPEHVASILMEMGLDAPTIAAALLHDTVEDTTVTLEQIEEQFGADIAMLVDGVTKLTRLEGTTKEEQQAESLRKMFLAMARDIRVVLIKLADRLHNMRTLQYRPPEKQRATARETLEIYAPLAHRLGIYRIKWELEDLSLFYLDREGYEELAKKINMEQAARMQMVQRVMDDLRDRLTEMHISGEVEGRPKHIYSIYKKMHQQNKLFEQIYDLYAVRVIVPTEKDCYAVLGMVHTLYKPIPGRFKDYIAVPKPNQYQSLHTTVLGERAMPFEVQIRTYEMHHTAEFGIAAHWKYKEGRQGQEGDDLDAKLSWLRQLMEWQGDMGNSQEFVNTLKVDLFSDEVFVFTPKGEVIDLPKGAGPLDFAYRIHSKVGDRCAGARVNGRIVPLDYQLENGDIVEIILGPTSKGPSFDWLKLVKTSNAKSKIRAYLKREFREENTVKGRDMLEREAKRDGYNITQLMKPEWVEAMIQKFSLSSVEDIYAAVGFGGLTTAQVLTKLKDEYRKQKKQELKEKREQGETSEQERKAREEKSQQISTSHGVMVKGQPGMLVRFAKCCNPLPGEDIVGYITRGRGVSIHRADCSNLPDIASEPDRFVEVSWGSEAASSYHVELGIAGQDREGFLADIINLLANMKVQVDAVNARRNRNNTVRIDLSVTITDTSQLDSIIKRVKKVTGVLEVFRAST